MIPNWAIPLILVGIFLGIGLIALIIENAIGGKYGTHTSTESDDHMAALMGYSAMHDDHRPGAPE